MANRSKIYKIPPEHKRNPNVSVSDYLWLAMIDDKNPDSIPVNCIPEDDWLEVYYIEDSKGRKKWKVINKK